MRRLVLANQLVLGTVNAGPAAFQAAVADLARFQERWPRQLPGLITGRHDLEDGVRLLTGPGSGMKHVIRLAAPR